MTVSRQRLTPGGRRAEAFADLLERPGHRSDDPSTAPYVALTSALQALPGVGGPRPEFRDALRQRLLAVATVQGVGAESRTPAERARELGSTWRFQRRMALVAGSAAAVTAITGVGLGASRSLPGDPLYGVKRATEDVQLATTFGQEAKGKRHLQFARTRLHEVEALVGKSSALTAFIPGTAGAIGPLSEEAQTSTIIATLREMDAETRAGADDLMSAYTSSGSTEPLRALDTFTRQQFAGLRDVLPALPADARPRAQLSLSLLHAVAVRTVDASTAGDSGAGGGSTPTPTSTPEQTQRPHRHHTTQPTTNPDGSGSTAGTGTGDSPAPAPVPTTTQPPIVPTVPPLPTKLPTILPTELPTLDVPLLSDLPLLGD